MWRGVATQVRTHRTHRRQKIRRLRQDATPADQTQDLFLLMHSAAPTATFLSLRISACLGWHGCERIEEWEGSWTGKSQG